MDSVVVFVAIWWTANMVATIASKTAISGTKPDTIESMTTWTPALKDLRWLELTMLQHVLGALFSNTWLFAVRGATAFPVASVNRKHMLLAAIGNVIGNLATNAAFAAVSSSLTQVIKSCEPIFTFVFTLLFYKGKGNLNCSLFISIIAMVLGTCMFISGELSFNIWGLTAAVISNIAFPIRNIYLKKLGELWEGPLQKFAAISNFSVLILLPFAVVYSQSMSALLPIESYTSAIFHLIYNAASLTVLQECSPLVHAILNLSKRMFVILANMIVFSSPFTLSTIAGLVFISTGHYIHQISRGSLPMISRRLVKKCLPLAIVIVSSSLYLFVFMYSTKPVINLLQIRQTAYTPQLATTAWVYERPIPHNVVENINSFQTKNPGLTVTVFCGSSQCMQAVQDLRNPGVTVKFLVLTDIVKNTTLEHWLVRHPLHKVVTGVSFEDHVYEAVRLALLWHYGGVHFNPLVKLDQFTIPKVNGAWVSIDTNITRSTRGILSVSQFRVQSTFIANLTEAFCREYSRNVTNVNPRLSPKFDFEAVVNDIYNLSCTSRKLCPEGVAINLSRIPFGNKMRRHFGTLSYDKRVRVLEYLNIGDEIQGIPGLQFLPFMDHLLERYKLGESKGEHHIRAFFNAWWGEPTMMWPPPTNIDPIMLSMHIAPQIRSVILKNVTYLQSKAPIGCRDNNTLAFLRRNNVDAYLSGCLTLFIKSPNIQQKKSGKIFLVDLREKYERLLPLRIAQEAIRRYHLIIGQGRTNSVERFQTAYKLLEEYSEARLVITQRIHCALPCVAMGIPVIFFNSEYMPGGNVPGHGKTPSPRVSGLTPLFHTLDAYQMSEISMVQWLRNFNWETPPPNPGVSLRMRLLASNWNLIRQDQALYDSARRFGLLPVSAPAKKTPQQLIFHVIVNSNRTSLEWPKWRTIESLFYHHPHSRVIVHSNSLKESQFDVLTEAGYDVEILSLDASIDAVSSNGASKTKNQKKPENNFNETLAKLAILFHWGGVYIDANVILLRQLDFSMTNTLIWSNEKRDSFDLSVMKFRRGHPFLKAAIQKGSDLQAFPRGKHSSTFMASIFHSWSNNLESSYRIHALALKSSLKKFNSKNANECSKTVPGTVDDSYIKQLQREVFGAKVMGLNNSSKLKRGTVCKHLLNSFCVLCNNIY
ncbi:uncharacterized protein LOC110980597 [Acanthaster planci]|uniref:Uncharacterized protein LOC110980597 n=1 Tax=Acanthaster planci TaxID=133434 RepID=A0A8B7YIR4_ACAPL|nr:uncharacterized protein LOC110980597 [Acanthaster planci]XP_022093129.1 uncharacterized protein LOC110980597 [Acanthaster planci]